MIGRAQVVKLLQQTGLNRIAHKAYYGFIHGFDSASSGLVEALERCFQEAKRSGVATRGDYLEFGIFKGYSFWYAQKTATELGLSTMRFFGFDSFAGLPEVSGVDKTPSDDFYKGQYACSKQQVMTNLQSKGVDWSRTHLVEGYFDKSLTPAQRDALGVTRAAIVLIDCDLYSSTRDVLRFLDPLIGDGTILIFDDWDCFGADDGKGQRKAVAEFLGRRSDLKAEDFFSYGDWGHVFIVRGKTQ